MCAQRAHPQPAEGLPARRGGRREVRDQVAGARRPLVLRRRLQAQEPRRPRPLHSPLHHRADAQQRPDTRHRLRGTSQQKKTVGPNN